VATSLKAAISHSSGAAWYGAALVDPPMWLHVTVPRSRGRRATQVKGVAIHRADLRQAEVSLLTRADMVAAAMRLPAAPGRLAAVTAAELIDPRAESVFESVTRVNLALAELPPPTPQYDVYDAVGSWIARVDFAWEDLGVILECDGFEYHQDRAAFERDRRRWTALTRAGWKVAVVTWRDVMHDPGYLVDVMADLLQAA
jgi:hypothetical protein